MTAASVSGGCRSDSGSATLRFSIELPAAEPLGPGVVPCLAISPDGSTVVYSVGGGRLLQRRLDEFTPHPLLPSAGASLPFFSPDGRRIGVYSEARLHAVESASGRLSPICEAPVPRGAVWISRQHVLLAPSYSSGLVRATIGGALSDGVTELDTLRGEVTHRWPARLPGGRSALFVCRRGSVSGFDDADIEAVDLATGMRRLVWRGGTAPQYSPSGHLLFVRGRRLFAVAFDPRSLQTQGAPFPVIDGIAASVTTGAAQYAVADNGTLVYAPSEPDSGLCGLQWIDRRGAASPATPWRGVFENARLSPDGARVAVTLVEAQNDIAICDLQSGTWRRLTDSPADDTTPVWSPDGTWIAFASGRLGPLALFRRRADGTGTDELLWRSKHDLTPTDWSMDGRTLLYLEDAPGTRSDIRALQVGRPGPGRALVVSEAAETVARLSPDGRSLLFASDAGGAWQIYRTSFPDCRNLQQLTTTGGTFAAWSRDGREVYYRDHDVLGAIDLTDPQRPRPQRLFEGPYLSEFDVAANGRQFLMVPSALATWPTRLYVVVGWARQLRVSQPK